MNVIKHGTRYQELTCKCSCVFGFTDKDFELYNIGGTPLTKVSTFIRYIECPECGEPYLAYLSNKPFKYNIIGNAYDLEKEYQSKESVDEFLSELEKKYERS